MIERKFLPLVVAVFVLTAGLSGSATVAVLSDSETVRVQVSPGNVTATVVDNASGVVGNATSVNATAAENGTEDVPTAEEVDGLVVSLDPVDGTTVDAGETTEYDVVVEGATEGIVSYDLTLELADPSVASFAAFDHHDLAVSNETEKEGGRLDASAGMGMETPTAVDEEHEITIGTVRIAGEASGTTEVGIVNEEQHTLNISANVSESGEYEIGTRQGSELTVTGTTDSPSAENDSYTIPTNEKNLSVSAEDGVLANDGGEDDDLTIDVVTNTTEGVLSLSDDGSFTYEPDNRGVDSDEFTYGVTDVDGDTDTATVSITVETPGGGGPDDGE